MKLFRLFSLSLLILLPFQAALSANFGSISPDDVAYIVQDINSGEILAEHNADQAMNPASVMKLLTTYTTLGLLGEDYRWQTQWTARAPIVNGVLQGNLFWRGTGDPSMDQKDIIAMQEQLKAKGIQRLDGDVVLDQSIWQNEGTAEGFEEDEGEVFAVPPDPHMLSYKVVWLEAYRQADGKIDVRLEPPLVSTPVIKDIHTIKKGRCSTLSRFLKVNWNGKQLHVHGRIPRSCAGQKIYVNMLDAQQFAEESFVGQWHKMGGEGPNRVRVGKAPEKGGYVLAEHQSKPLKEVVRDMNKFSNNLIARTLFLNLGGKKAHNSIQDARKITRTYLTINGIDTIHLRIENGSGLSRDARISARSVAQLLNSAYHAPFRQAFIDSLPVAGHDGTLKHRLRDYPDLHLKTGTLKDARALAGFRLPENNEQPLAIVLLLNSPEAKKQMGDLDNLLRSLLSPVTPP